jgi:hypothetical protein
MPTLTTDQKVFIVSSFARYHSVSDVVRDLKERFGVDVEGAQLYGYHPDNANFRAAQKWKTLFESERKKFLDNVGSIGIAQKTVRLQRLEHLCVLALQRKNVKLAAELMEQAAKEMGEVFSNRREVRAESRSITATMTTEELRNEIINDLGKLGVDAAGLAVPGLGLRDDTKH